jgi:hypothetical protein
MGGALLLSVKRGADKRESNDSEEERKKEEDTETLVSPLHGAVGRHGRRRGACRCAAESRRGGEAKWK